MMTSINSFAALTNVNPILIVLLAVWSIIWKGLALWKAASLRQKYWFVAILIINTFGILDIIYYFFVSKNYKVEVVKN